MPSARASGDPTRPVGVAVSTPYLAELESLRGIAMVLVLLFHLDSMIQGTSQRIGGEIVSPALAYVRAGHTGVNLFFILSAFLLSLPFLAQVAGGKAVSVPRYFQRRALRILPLYYAAVLAAALLCATTAAEVLRALPYLLFLHQIAGLTESLMPYSAVWWSLATEAQFYLVLPLLPVALGSRRGRVVAAFALMLWGLAYCVFVTGNFPFKTAEAEMFLGLSLFGRLPMFLAGMGAAWLYLTHGERLRRRLADSPVLRHGGADLVLLAVLLCLGYLLRWVVWIGAHLAQRAPAYQVWHLVEGPLWTAVLLLLLLAPLRLKGFLSNSLLSKLGVLSYSLYILHVPVIALSLRFLRERSASWIGWNGRTAIVGALLCIVCACLAEVTYRAIERPFLFRKERLQA